LGDHAGQLAGRRPPQQVIQAFYENFEFLALQDVMLSQITHSCRATTSAQKLVINMHHHDGIINMHHHDGIINMHHHDGNINMQPWHRSCLGTCIMASSTCNLARNGTTLGNGHDTNKTVMPFKNSVPGPTKPHAVGHW